MNNPFSLSFGKEPQNIIKRGLQHNEIIETFKAINPMHQVYMITGIRGAGKTVTLTTIAHELAATKNWIVLNLSPERNLLDSMAASIRSRNEIIDFIRTTKISLSALGLGIQLGGTNPITDSVVFLNKALEKLTADNKRVLITIDEVVSNENIREFVSQFQIFMRENYNVFLLMTGLYENIYNLQNEKTMTFLYRAPKIELDPLSLPLIADSYRKVFEISQEDAMSMAKVTKGYPFAFQVLGYLCYKNNTTYENVLPEFDTYLEDYVYEKIWSEMSDLDKKIAMAIGKSSTKVADIREHIGIDSNKFNVYRKRLLKKGIIRSASYGHLEFVLPRFQEFVNRNYCF